MSNDDVFKSPLRLRFGKSPKKSEKRKEELIYLQVNKAQ